jgi:DNA-binding MarR family transcriptional regulator
MDEHLDVVAVTLLCGLALNEDVMRRLKDRGHGDLRFSHGFVVQHLVEGPVAVGELARRMGVSQQAASKVTAELESLGYLERSSDPSDGRVRRVGLSKRGREAIEDTRAARAEAAELLAKRLGIAPGRVSVVRGASGRDKLIEIDGMEAEAVHRALSISAPPDRR